MNILKKKAQDLTVGETIVFSLGLGIVGGLMGLLSIPIMDFVTDKADDVTEAISDKVREVKYRLR